MSKKKYLFYIAQNYSYAILRPLEKAIRSRGDDVYWFLDGNDVNADYLSKSEKRLSTVSEVNEYKPDAVFVPGNYIPSFIHGLKVAVFHGFNVEKRNSKKGHFNIRGCYDLYCTQGPNTTGPFKKLAEKHQFFSVKETGWPAIDPLYEYQKEKKDRPTILMCSTFSKQLSCAPLLFETVKRLSAEGRWNWIIQFHPKMDKIIVEQYKSIQGEHLTFVETDNVIPLLQKADVMVCDTSSVLVMFLLLNKPVVTFRNSAPKPCFLDINDENKLEESIELALTRPKELMSEITTFIEQTHPYKDGKSAERVLDAVEERLSGIGQPLKRKPFIWIKYFKKRKKLNYWKFW